MGTIPDIMTNRENWAIFSRVLLFERDLRGMDCQYFPLKHHNQSDEDETKVIKVLTQSTSFEEN